MKTEEEITIVFNYLNNHPSVIQGIDDNKIGILQGIAWVLGKTEDRKFVNFLQDIDIEME